MPYFGKLPNYFDLWIQSCYANSKTDWIIVTDNLIKNDFDNIKILNMSFDDFKARVQSKFDFKIKIDEPYKLCDLRPLYGHIFEDIFAPYDFWGWCDCDVIFGDLSKILTEDIWNNYERILDKGHLSFVRNTKEINNIILSQDYVKTILTGKAIYAWDEIYDGYYKGLNQILIDSNLPVFDGKHLVSDIDYRHKYFRIVEEQNTNNVFEYRDGNLYKYSLTNNEILKTETLYIHLQKRKMEVCTSNVTHYFIVPDKFDDTIQEYDITKESIVVLNEDVSDYFDEKKENKWYAKRQFQRFLHEPHKVAAIKYIIKNRG